MSTATTEAPFVVSHNFCAVRANTVEELRERLTEFANDASIAALISGFRNAVSSTPVAMQGVTQQAAQPAPVTTQQAVENLAAGGITGTVVPQSLEEVADKWGNVWTYGHPDAPALPDGRGKYARKRGTSKAGSPYVGWFDPAKGPKPFPTGASEAPTIWDKR